MDNVIISPPEDREASPPSTWIPNPENLLADLQEAFKNHPLRIRIIEAFHQLNDDPETFIIDEEFNRQHAARALEAAFRILIDDGGVFGEVTETDLDPEILLDIHYF